MISNTGSSDPGLCNIKKENGMRRNNVLLMDRGRICHIRIYIHKYSLGENAEKTIHLIKATFLQKTLESQMQT